MPSLAALRHAPWSSSKVKTALRCPQEFHYRYVDGIPEPEVSAEQRIGKAVHAALELVLQRRAVDEALGLGRELLLLEGERERYDLLAPGVRAFVARIDAFRQRRQVRSELVEHKVAFDALLNPTEFLAQDAFYRGVLDAGFEYGDGELAVIDHKTGMRRLAVEYADQLEGYAALVVAGSPQVKRIWLGVHFVPDAAMEWIAPVRAEAVRGEFMPRLVESIEQAGRAVAGGPEPRPGRQCSWCSYRSICPAMRAMAAAAAAEAEREAARLAEATAAAAEVAVAAAEEPAVEPAAGRPEDAAVTETID
jgi:putative RecB family exonuclease